MINKKRLIRLTQDVLRINSENPPGNEAAIAAYVSSYLKRVGLKVRTYSFFADRDNVMAVLPASDAKKRKSNKPLLITPHLDTVPAGKGWKFDPFGGKVCGGKIYGRGSTDCKGNLAVALEVVSSLVEDGAVLTHDLIFLATADEETGSAKGLQPFLKKSIIRPAYALILDSDEFDIISSQKGLIHFKVRVAGRRAHGAYPERGINAIQRASELMSLLQKFKFSYKKHKFLKPPTINIGTIMGGDKVNMVPDWCEFEADLRFLPGMDSSKILSDIKDMFKKTGFKAEITINDIQEPYEIDTQHPMIKALKAAAKGIVPESKIKGSEGATVITFFKKSNIPAVATGYGARGTAHATDEYARLIDLYRGAQVLERFIKIFDNR